MPKHPGKKKQTNAEFQAAEFPGRVAAARSKANAALEADRRHSPMLSVAERGRHQEALKAADRVEARLGKGKKKAHPKHKAPPSTPKTRQRAAEKITGTDKITNPLRAVNELASEARKNKR